MPTKSIKKSCFLSRLISGIHAVIDQSGIEHGLLKVNANRLTSRLCAILLPVAVLVLFMSCAAGTGESPIGDPAAFQGDPLEIYVAVASEDATEPGFDDGGSPGTGDPAADVDPPPAAKGCLWQALTAPGAEETGYGIYVYVLLDAPPSARIRPDGAVTGRNRVLIRAITETAGPPVPDADPEDAIMFVLPAKTRPAGRRFGITDYDFDVSRQLKGHVARLVGEAPDRFRRLTQRPGPFLMAALHPLGRLKAAGDALLYVDLSDAAADDIGRIIRVFSERIPREIAGERFKFSYLRLKLFPFLENTQENLKVLRTVPAQ